jgi:transcriptional regulator with XRE-family HTH domain
MRGLTAAQLATRCTELGLPISRSKIANIENGRARQEGVSIAEMLALAAALEVPALLLLVSLGSAEPVEVLPGRSVDPWLAYRWLLGEVPTDELGKGQDADVHLFDSGSPHTAVIRTYRQHDGALMRYLVNRRDDDQSRQTRDTAIGPLAAARIKMHENGWRLPPLPRDVAEALEPALLAWGWREQEPGALVRLEFDVTEVQTQD